MTRIARVVVPGLPRHVTQRGGWREPVSFGAEDSALPPSDRDGGAARRCGDLGLFA
jgi:hypothetical protein